jgi:hypothetical protein
MIDHFLFTHPYALTVALFLATAASSAMGGLAFREYRAQTVIVRDDFDPPGAMGKVRSLRGRLLLPLVTTTFVAISCFVLDSAAGTEPSTRSVIEFLGGGWLLLALAGVALGLSSTLHMRALRRQDAADGHLHYSAAYCYRSGAAQLAAVALLLAVSYLLTLQLAFLGAAVFSTATAAGYYRRARQATRSAARTGSSPVA